MKSPHPDNSIGPAETAEKSSARLQAESRENSAEMTRLRILEEESRHHREISRQKLDEEIKAIKIRRWLSVAVIIAGISLTVFAFLRGHDIAAGMIGAATIGGFLRSGK